MTKTIATLFVGLLVVTTDATDAEDPWMFPGASIAKVYDWSEDVAPAVLEHVSVPKRSYAPFRGLSRHVSARRKLPMERWVSLLGEDSVDTRIHSDVDAGASQVATSQAVGLGAGAGEGANTLTSKANAAVRNSMVTAVATAQSHNATELLNATVKTKQPLPTRTWFSMLRFTFSFAFVVKTLCMMCNIFYQASPLPLITSFQSKGDTGDSDIAPFIATCYGGWQWCFYGLFAYIVTQKSGFLVLVYSNVVGALLGLYYVWAFNANCKNMAMLQRSTKYYGVLGSIVLIQLVGILTMQPVRALFFSGLISSVWSTVASLSLISTVPTVYERKSCASLPVPLLVMGVISAALWILCGVMLWDPWITFPNLFSFHVCVFALYLCCRFPADGPQSLDKIESECDTSFVDTVEDATCSDDAACLDVRASPLQRALAYVVSGSDSQPENRPIHDQVAISRKYGTTGGTGDEWS
jgi:hypothetical protein